MVRFRIASMLLHLGHPFDPALGYPAMDERTVRAVGLGEPESYDDWSLYVEFAARCRQQALDTALDLRTVDRGLFHVGESST